MNFSRRTFLRTAALGLVAAPVACSAPSGPALVSSSRPVLTHGVAVGDPRADGALVWARADRPATMIVETAPTEAFADPRRFTSGLLTPDTDGTGRLRLTGLEPGQTVHYRVTLEGDDGARSEPVTGIFRTAPAAPGDIRLQWSGDTAGQGFGINPDIGGMTIFETMARRDPHLFLHSGDVVYADGPLKETVTLPDGRVWRNEVSEAKSAVAQTLDEFRGQYAYNLTDRNYLRFNSSVAQIVQWDDHETVNNWYPGEILDLKEYTEKNVDVLAARAMQAFHEWNPLDPTEAVDGRVYRKIPYGPLLDVFVLDMRSYKDANSDNTAASGHVLGGEQERWLIDQLTRSTATWKIIAADLPIGLAVPDGDTDFIEEAYSAALQELPRHLPTHGLEPVGIDDLRVAIADRFTDRGLPTSPDAIMVTSGAQHALRLLLGLVAAPGDRALVDHPTYPNALEAMRRGGVRPVPVAVRPENPGSAWDLVALRSAARQSGARMAYLIPDFHNPTGACLGDAGRAELAALARESGMMLVVDETMVDLWLDAPPPAPVASFASGSAQRDVVTIGSAAKSFWGGLRIGWIRADPELVNRLAGARAAVDLGTPVVDQLAAAYLVRRDGGLLDERRALLRDQRSVLLDALGLGLPDWEVSPGPGGLSTWVRMPGPVSSALAAAAPAHGVVLAAGPRFGVEGAFERFVRLPYARPADDLRLGVERLARAYEPLRGAAEHAPALVV